MKRVVIASLVVVGVAALVAFLGNGFPRTSTTPKTQYTAEIDNAFGLIKGGDLKIAGVRAGTITKIELDKRTFRAKVGFNIKEKGFGDLRADVTCETRPQSLIGEYFLDCDPGTDKKKLKQGSVIPVERTSSTVPPDLVNNILRRPQAERLSIILSSLGAGVAGTAERLNETIRRASPALRETDRVLAILARQNRTIANLNRSADEVVGELAANKDDVVDWVDKARNLSRDSAERRTDIAAGFRKLPAFLAELEPTMAALGRTADAQTPALRTLADNADRLETFFNRLGPFSDASRPAIDALGEASKVGSETAEKARPTVRQLGVFAKDAPELGRNLAIVLEHLDDRENRVTTDTRAAKQQGVSGPSGYSGFEALLQYVLDQTTSINLYDQSVHILAVQAFESRCADYRDAEILKKEADFKEILAQCQAKLGPNSPGVETPDPSTDDAPPRQIDYVNPAGGGERSKKTVRPRRVPASRDEQGKKTDEPKRDEPKRDDDKRPDVKPPVKVPDAGEVLPGAPKVPEVPQVPAPQVPNAVPDAVNKAVPPLQGKEQRDGNGKLLDYLLG